MDGRDRHASNAVARPRRGGSFTVCVAALLALAALLAVGCTRQRPGVEPEPARLPVGQHPLGAKWDWSRLDRFAPYLRQLTGGATFHELVWCDVERERGARDWTGVDEVARETRRLGFTLYLKIRVGSCWATGGRGEHIRGAKGKTESLMPRDLAAYTEFVRDAVSRYAPRGVHEYAIENEVNSASMWGGSPEDLIRLVTVAGTAIRSADPKAVVVDPGISSTAYGEGIAAQLMSQGRTDEAVRAYQSYYERRFSTRHRQLPQVSDAAGLRAVLRSEQAQRNLTYLRVARELTDRHLVDVRQLHFYEKWTNLPLLLDYLGTQVPAGMPIEAWEVGMFLRDGDPGDQARADEVTKVVTQLLRGGVRRVIWLPLAYDPAGRHPDEPRFGLLDPQGGVRESGKAVLALADRMKTRG